MEQKTKTLVGSIQNFIKQYVWLPSNDVALILALWVIHTYAFEASRTTPYLYIHSPEKQSGKTRLIEIMSILVRNPLMAMSMTGPVLFRALGTFNSPTLLLDEIDTFFNGAKHEEMRAVLNGGYRRGGHVWRVVKGEPHKFNVFGPKLLAGINNGKLPDTVQDRSIAIRLRRKPKHEGVEPFYMADVQGSDELEDMLYAIERWTEANVDSLSLIRPEPITEISDRKWEISEPLIAIAQRMGIEDEARQALTTILLENYEEEGLTPQQELLLSIREAFDDLGRDRIFTSEIIEHLEEDVNGKWLGVQLKPYGIQPHVIRIANCMARGYLKSQFEGTWDSYL